MSKNPSKPTYETTQTGVKPGTATIRSRRLWTGATEAHARKAAENADLSIGPVSVTCILPNGERQLCAVYDRNPNVQNLDIRTTRETTDQNTTEGTSDMTTTENTTTEPTVYTCYVWNAEGKVKGKPQERKTLTGAIQFADKQSTTPGIREVTILGDDGTRRVSRHGETTEVAADEAVAAAEQVEQEAAPAPAKKPAPAAKPEADKNPNKVAAAKATIKPKQAMVVEVGAGKVKLLDYKGSNTKYAQTLPKGARWVAYDPATKAEVVLAKKPTEAELADVKGWAALAMPTEAPAPAAPADDATAAA